MRCGTTETPTQIREAARVTEILDKLDPEVTVVSGYHTSLLRSAVRWSKEHNRLCILTSASQRRDRSRFFIKELFKGWWVRRHFDAAFVGGARSADYLVDLGFHPERIWRGYDSVNNEYFEAKASEVRQSSPAWREKLTLPDQYFLYVGRFAPEKNLTRMMMSYRRYRTLSPETPWDLVLVGNGPMEASLRQMVDQQNIQGVHLTGFQSIELLPAYYALASCFLLPSISEPWGLVVNEAMACRLPVLVSAHCGASADLVFPGINGYVFDPLDVEGLAWLMERMSSTEVDRHAMGAMSSRHIAEYTPNRWARALADCIYSLTRARREAASKCSRPLHAV